MSKFESTDEKGRGGEVRKCLHERIIALSPIHFGHSHWRRLLLHLTFRPSGGQIGRSSTQDEFQVSKDFCCEYIQ
jgi:hypothetical protein